MKEPFPEMQKNIIDKIHELVEFVGEYSKSADEEGEDTNEAMFINDILTKLEDAYNFACFGEELEKVWKKLK